MFPGTDRRRPLSGRRADDRRPRSASGDVQEALARSEERYQLLIEGLRDYAIFVLSPDGCVASWTGAAERILGYAESEVVGQHVRIFFTDVDRERGVPERLVADACAHGRVEAVGWRVGKNGRTFWGEEIATAVYDAAGNLRGISKMTRDITERMIAETERERLLRKMTEANRIKDEFLGIVSHELRTPLNSILGWTKLLRDGRLASDVAARAIETIERNASAQARLVDDLLDVSRIVGGRLRLNVTPTSMTAVVGAAIEMLRPLVDAKHIELSVELDPDVDGVLADPGRLQQIVWNLVANAIKFTPTGGVVRVETCRKDGQLELQVSDSGKGIAPEFLPLVFDSFRQADSTSTRAHSGLGLGLAIVRHLVELHGGTVQASSAGLGKGATFRVRLPLTSSSPQAVRPSAGHIELDEAALRGLRVLLMDDDEDTCQVIAASLRGCGIEVIAVRSAMEGLDALADARPDVIVGDIGMPERDGYWFIRQVRAGGTDVAATPAIALTAYARQSDAAQALDAGFQVHLTKPVEFERLLAAIARLAAGDTEA